MAAVVTGPYPFRLLLRGLIGLTLLALVAFLPGFASIPVIDRDEARFVQASRQMVQTGDLVDIRLGDEARLKKPAGIYWMQAGAAVLSGQGDTAPLWVHRLPSLLGAVAAVLLVAVAGAPLVGWPAALGAGALMAVTLVLQGEARIAKTDAALLATIMVGQAVLMRLHMRDGELGRGWVYGFWLALALGVLLKGPMGFAVLAPTAGVLSLLRRDARWLGPLASPGAIVLALVVMLPWFVAITLQGGGQFWQDSLGEDFLPKIAAGQEGKGARPGTYLLAMWFTLWPVGTLFVLALPGLWRDRRTPAVLALVAWVVPFWFVLELVPTKLIHYPMPLYPALALAAAAWGPEALLTAGVAIRGLAALALLPGLGLGAGLLWFSLSTGTAPVDLWVLIMGLGLGVAVVLAGITVFALVARRAGWMIPLSVALGLGLHAGIFPALARTDALWPGHRAVAEAQVLGDAAGCTALRIAGWGFTEPSLLWLAGKDTPLLGAYDALPDDLAMGGACSFVIRAVQAGQAPPPTSCTPRSRFEGVAPGAGKWVILDLLTCGDAQ